MKISFIVITYQRGELLQQCVDSIVSQTGLAGGCELIIVDNGGTAKIIPPPDTWGSFLLYKSAENLGVAGGRNKGIKIATGDYLIFIDDDAIFSSNDIAQKLVQVFDQNEQCGIVAGRSLSESHETIVSELPFPNKNYALSLETNAKAPYFYGVVHAIRSSALQEMVAYPQRYFYSMEELDLSLRIIDEGWEIIFVPSVTVIHYKSNLGREVISDKYWYRNALNKMQLGWRLLPLPYPITIMMIWSGAALWNTRNPLLVLRIWRDFIQLIPTLRRERKPIQADAIAYLQRTGGRLLF